MWPINLLARWQTPVAQPKSWHRLAVAVLLTLALAFIGTTTAFIALKGDSLGLWLALMRPMFIYYFAWLFLVYLLYWFITLTHNSWAKLPLLVLGHLGLVGVVTLLMPIITQTDNWRSWLLGEYAVGFNALNLFIYATAALAVGVYHFFRLSRQQQLIAGQAMQRAQSLEVQLNSTRINALMMQMNPHFLFNALNSVAALIETKKNEEAYRTTELLGGMLRRVLEWRHCNLVPLGEELACISDYMALEKIRFGDRVQFDVVVDDALLKMQVPPFLLQPLLENSVKHGVACTSAKVQIELDIKVDAGTLVMGVRNNGPDLPLDHRAGQGLGLTNITQRLNLLYGQQATIVVANQAQGGVCSCIRIPLSALVTPLANS